MGSPKENQFLPGGCTEETLTKGCCAEAWAGQGGEHGMGSHLGTATLVLRLERQRGGDRALEEAGVRARNVAPKQTGHEEDITQPFLFPPHALCQCPPLAHPAGKSLGHSVPGASPLGHREVGKGQGTCSDVTSRAGPFLALPPTPTDKGPLVSSAGV